MAPQVGVVSGHDEKIQLIFAAIKELMDEKKDPPLRNPVGYKIQGKSDDPA